MSDTHLRPCPFCGSRNLSIDHLGSEERPFFVVSCGDCEAEGPIHRTAPRAIEAWNTRHRPKPDGHPA